MSEYCESCRFFLITRNIAGKCRRYPPKVVMNPDFDRLDLEYPLMLPNGWCGEFQPQKEHEEGLQ
jgi:hypothetical protein